MEKGNIPLTPATMDTAVMARLRAPFGCELSTAATSKNQRWRIHDANDDAIASVSPREEGYARLIVEALNAHFKNNATSATGRKCCVYEQSALSLLSLSVRRLHPPSPGAPVKWDATRFSDPTDTRKLIANSPEVQYSFTVTTDLKPGHAAKVDAFGGPASLAKTEVIFPQHIIINVPCPGFLEITSIRINGIECLAQEVDGFAFAASGVSPVLDLPSLTSLSRVRVLGRYTGLCPPPLVAAGKRAKPLHVLGSYMPKGHYAPWKLTVTFHGPLRRGKL